MTFQDIKLAIHLAKRHFYNFKKDYRSCKEKGEYAKAIHAVDYLKEDIKDIIIEVNEGALTVSKLTFDKYKAAKIKKEIDAELGNVDEVQPWYVKK